MISAARNWFIQNFTQEKYQQYIQNLEREHPHAIQFRIAETPVFIPKSFEQQMLDTTEYIISIIGMKGFKAMTDSAVPDYINKTDEGEHPHFMVFDFGIAQKQDGTFEPQLVEMQGFPSLFMYQLYQEATSREAFEIPEDYTQFLNGFDKEKVIEKMHEIVLGNENPENVILLELFPEKQKTKIDFYYTQDHLNIPIVCLSEIKKHGNQLFYTKDNQEIPIHRIYNRLIWDDIIHHGDEFIRNQAQMIMEKDLQVHWVTHPSWFYRVSKFTLPFLRHPNIPETRFLSEYLEPPKDLENYVLKPLFSFGGQGVKIHVTPYDFWSIQDPENYILQKKVDYAAVINTPSSPVKAEIRIFYFWDENGGKPVATHNLARLTREEMIGVSYNHQSDWVGGSFALFEK